MKQGEAGRREERLGGPSWWQERVLLSAQWSVVRDVATRGASGDLAGPADWASQPGQGAGPG